MFSKTPIQFTARRLEAFDKCWTKKLLPNGMTAIHVPVTTDDSFYIGVMIRSGSRLESPKKIGLAHFLEHMMFRGSKHFPRFTELAEAFEWLGGDWNAATGYEHTEYWYTGIVNTAPEVIRLFAEFLHNPSFNDIEVERNIVIRELEGETNDHGHSIDLDYHIATLMWPDTPIAQPILGSRDTIMNFTIKDLQKFRNAHYTPADMSICIVGGEDSSLLNLVEQSFAGYGADFAAKSTANTFKKLPEFSGPAVKWIEHSDNEYEIMVSFPCAGEWSPKAQIYHLISRLLTDGFCSRLGRSLREEMGLVYSISAAANLGPDRGTIDIHASCAQDQLDRYLEQLLKQLQIIAGGGIEPDEVQRVIQRSIVDVELATLDQELVAGRLNWTTLCGKPCTWAGLRDEIQGIRPADVLKVAAEIFRPENTAIAILGPEGKDIEKRALKSIRTNLSF
jgi:predicted Zn-dependent peptidase